MASTTPFGSTQQTPFRPPPKPKTSPYGIVNQPYQSVPSQWDAQLNQMMGMPTPMGATSMANGQPMSSLLPTGSSSTPDWLNGLTMPTNPFLGANNNPTSQALGYGLPLGNTAPYGGSVQPTYGGGGGGGGGAGAPAPAMTTKPMATGQPLGATTPTGGSNVAPPFPRQNPYNPASIGAGQMSQLSPYQAANTNPAGNPAAPIPNQGGAFAGKGNGGAPNGTLGTPQGGNYFNQNPGLGQAGAQGYFGDFSNFGTAYQRGLEENGINTASGNPAADWLGQQVGRARAMAYLSMLNGANSSNDVPLINQFLGNPGGGGTAGGAPGGGSPITGTALRGLMQQLQNGTIDPQIGSLVQNLIDNPNLALQTVAGGIGPSWLNSATQHFLTQQGQRQVAMGNGITSPDFVHWLLGQLPG